jgi:hypothetical protein
MAMPHLALEVVAAVGCIIVIAVAGLLALADVTPNPVSQNWLATAHSGVEVKSWLFKTAIVVAANVLAGFGQLQCMLIMIAAGWTAYVHVRYVSRTCGGVGCCRCEPRTCVLPAH